MACRKCWRLPSAFWVIGLGLVAGIGAADDKDLPDPLSLEQALRLAELSHPAIELAAAERDSARAGQMRVQALAGIRLTAQGALRAVQPSHVSINRDSNDSYARLSIRKRLYDFGFTQAASEEAQAQVAGSEQSYLDARQRRRLDVMQRFFEALLADLTYAHDNEAMATAFVAVDKARDRNGLGQVSDVDLLALESTYQTIRARRTASQARQRAARARLANALNRPEQLPGDLLMPEAPNLRTPVPEFEPLLVEVLANNPRLRVLRAEVAAAEQAVAAAKTEDGPVLRGELAAATYNRETSSTFPLEAGLVLEVPLVTGGLRTAQVAEARAEARRARARLAQAELDMRQAVLENWLELGNVQVRLEAAEAQADYRELYLDRARALYELEVRTDLGDAMVESSAARLEHTRAILDWLLLDAKLKALAGHLFDEADLNAAQPEKAP